LPSTIYAAPRNAGYDRLRVGLIGAGTRAKWLTRALSRESHRAELVAVCDCHLPQIDLLASDNKDIPGAGDSWKRYQNYEQMFEQEEVHAVMIATPDHVRVQPTAQTKLKSPPALSRIQPDSVARLYLQPAAEWHRLTPVILPGHDDHEPAKTRKLIEKALRQTPVPGRVFRSPSERPH
jgi:hypothetical protein